jgi:citrate lyase subunit beta/citryl-CoA lyase
MILRSLLFVPADSQRKQARALDAGADALILDLEDSVAPSAKLAARQQAVAFLQARPADARWLPIVRVNPLSSGLLLDDLTAIIGAPLSAILLPKADGPADVAVVSHYLTALEARAGVALGSTKLIVLATETARALATIGGYAHAGLDRLIGLTWGAEDLPADLGALAKTDADGSLSFTYRLARSLCLAAARAAGVAPIETVFTNVRDADGLTAWATAARREGFSGQLAIHPDQVPIINAAFTPSAEAVAQAQAVLAAFAAAPGAGVVSLEGRMLDAPHRRQAERTLALAAQLADWA